MPPDGVPCRKPKLMLAGYSKSVRIFTNLLRSLRYLQRLRLKNTTFGSSEKCLRLVTSTFPYSSVSILSSTCSSTSSLPRASLSRPSVLPLWSSSGRSSSLNSSDSVLLQGLVGSREDSTCSPWPSHSSFSCGHILSSSSRNPNKNSWISCCLRGSGKRPQAYRSSLAFTGPCEAFSDPASRSSTKTRLMASMSELLPSKSRIVLRSGRRKQSIWSVEFIQHVLPSFWMPLKLSSRAASFITVISMASIGFEYASTSFSSMIHWNAGLSGWGVNLNVLQLLSSPMPQQMNLTCIVSSELTSNSPKLSTICSPRQGTLLRTSSPRCQSRSRVLPFSVIHSKQNSWQMRQSVPNRLRCYSFNNGTSLRSLRCCKQVGLTTKQRCSSSGSVASEWNSQLEMLALTLCFSWRVISTFSTTESSSSTDILLTIPPATQPISQMQYRNAKHHTTTRELHTASQKCSYSSRYCFRRNRITKAQAKEPPASKFIVADPQSLSPFSSYNMIELARKKMVPRAMQVQRRKRPLF